jgi:outer membrane receptor protein involved in Fe transport
VVTGQRSTLRTSIDRLSYDVANDLQTRTGSVADALRNVPGVEVDVQGNVSLRGDGNVTIMIDGRPSNQFQGEGRGDALQQFPADQISRVEVITNPGAGMSPEGTAGVINLVTKQNRQQGGSGSVRASVGTEGRWNVGASGTRRMDKLTLTGDIGYRAAGGETDDLQERGRLDTATGQFINQTTRGVSNVEGGGFRSARLAADYDINKQDRLSAELTHRGFGHDLEGRQLFEERLGAAPVSRAYDRATDTTFDRAGTELRTSWRRRFGEASQSASGSDHELVVDARLERTEVERETNGRFTNRLPTAPDSAERFKSGVTSDEGQLRVEFSTPMPGEAKLRMGLDGEVEANAFNNFGARGPTLDTLTVVPSLSNAFDYDQQVIAAFASYERPFGDFTVQGGLRLEQVDIEIDQITTGVKAKNDYFRAYPSLFATYDLENGQRLRASYGRRIQRPRTQDLNPFRVFVDPQNFRQGNPNLLPEITDSFEAGWQYRQGGTFYLATAFYRESKDGVTDVVRDIGGGVFLTTRENLGQSRRAGLELTANGRLNPKLSYNVSGTAQWNELESRIAGLPATRDGTSLSARFNLNWSPTPNDFFQINGAMNGEQLQAQGVRKASGMLNLGYRRKVSEQLSFVVTAQNVLDSFKEEVVLDTPTLRERSERNFMPPALFVGFTWSFGDVSNNNRRQREPGFEFEQAAPQG